MKLHNGITDGKDNSQLLTVRYSGEKGMDVNLWKYWTYYFGVNLIMNLDHYLKNGICG